MKWHEAVIVGGVLVGLYAILSSKSGDNDADNSGEQNEDDSNSD